MDIQKHYSNTINEISENIIHIKKTPSKSGGCHVFWNKHTGEIIPGRSRVHLPVPSIAHKNKYQSSYDDMSRSEIQIGDSVCYVFAKPILPIFCASVIGSIYHLKKQYLFLQANSPKSPIQKTWARYQKDRFILVADNHCNDINYRRLAANNLIYATYQDELEAIEQYYALIRSQKYILQLLTRPNVVFGQNALAECHKLLFGGIYQWAGQYRKEEVVVTHRNFPTMHPDDIYQGMREFSSAFASKYLGQIKGDPVRLLDALVFAHIQLAWIHPFSDGNGRAIRLYLEAIAKTRGFPFSLAKAVSTNRQKHYYHYAVRRAIKQDTKYLREVLAVAIHVK